LMPTASRSTKAWETKKPWLMRKPSSAILRMSFPLRRRMPPSVVVPPCRRMHWAA